MSQMTEFSAFSSFLNPIVYFNFVALRWSKLKGNFVLYCSISNRFEKTTIEGNTPDASECSWKFCSEHVRVKE